MKKEKQRQKVDFLPTLTIEKNIKKKEVETNKKERKSRIRCLSLDKRGEKRKTKKGSKEDLLEKRNGFLEVRIGETAQFRVAVFEDEGATASETELPISHSPDLSLTKDFKDFG